MVRSTFHTKPISSLNKCYFSLSDHCSFFHFLLLLSAFLWNMHCQSKVCVSKPLTGTASKLHLRKSLESVGQLSGLKVREAVKRAVGQQGPPCPVLKRRGQGGVNRLHNTYMYGDRKVSRSYGRRRGAKTNLLWGDMFCLITEQTKQFHKSREGLIRPGLLASRLHLCRHITQIWSATVTVSLLSQVLTTTSSKWAWQAVSLDESSWEANWGISSENFKQCSVIIPHTHSHWVEK